MFATEVELCAAFIKALRPEWTAFAETMGWDILLSRSPDGCQIGVQAKLKLNADVLLQAAECRYRTFRRGPDYRAVLVPAIGSGVRLAALAAHCSVTVIIMRGPGSSLVSYYPTLPSARARGVADDWHELMPSERYPLPEYVPDVPAGASAPVQLTPWKIAALKLAVLLERSGYLTRDDFKRQGVDIRRWISGGSMAWLLPGKNGFSRTDSCPDFKAMHPKVYAEIEADPDKWGRGPVPETINV